MNFLDRVYKALGKNPHSLPDNEHTKPIKEKTVMGAIKLLKETPKVANDADLIGLVAKLLKSEAAVRDLREQTASAESNNENLVKKVRTYQAKLREFNKNVLSHPEFKKLRWQYEELLNQHDLDAKTIAEYFSDENQFKKDAKAHKKISNQLKYVLEQAELDTKTIAEYFADEQKFKAEIADIGSKLRNYESELHQKNDVIADNQETIGGLSRAKSDLEAQLEKMGNDYISKIAEKDAEINDKSEELRELTLKLSYVQGRYETSEKSIGRYKTQVENLKKGIGELVAERNELSIESRVYLQEINDLNKIAEKVIANLDAKSKEAQEYAVNATLLGKEKSDLQKELSVEQGKVSDLTTNISDLTAKLDNSGKAIKSMKRMSWIGAGAAAVIAATTFVYGALTGTAVSEAIHETTPNPEPVRVENKTVYIPVFGIEDKK